VLHQIGAGALGPVFRAYEPDRDRLVAVKLFRLDLPPERVHQLVAEFEQLIAVDLGHAAIAAPRATGIEGVTAYLAQDYVAAESLDIVVRENGPARVADALQVAARLAEALDYAAARQIVHGALHPRDVLLSTDELRLVGLGVTRALERVGVSAPVRRPYAAPERIGGGAWDRRADVFSFAAVMHELIWGRRLAGTGAHAADAIPETAGADLMALRDVFACALAEDMADRFATATEFADALAEAFAVAPAKVSPITPRLVEPRLPLDREAGGEGPGENVHGGPDLALFAPEPPRYQEVDHEVDVDVEAAAPLPLLAAERVTEPAGFLSVSAPIEPSGLSLVWPLALAGLVGSALGFGAGYAVAIRDRPSAGAAGNNVASVAAASTASTKLTGREFTERVVGERQGAGDVRLEPDAATAKPDAARVSTPGATKAATPSATVTAPVPKPAAPTPLATKPPASAGPAIAPPLFAGRVLVRSTPPGARVFVDGRSGGETPATVRDLARGAHQVRLVREGYTTVERRIVVTASQPALSLTVPMVKVPVASARLDAALVVESRPAGATVFVDGRQAGTTPLTLPGVSVGAHAVRLELEGYQRWSASVQVVASEQNRVTASLER
jgi:serine/threonine-protein kinase